jgi:hypothetical protein
VGLPIGPAQRVATLEMFCTAVVDDPLDSHNQFGGRPLRARRVSVRLFVVGGVVGSLGEI